MYFIYLLKGIIIGFSLAAPVGPIGVLCIRRTLAYGWKRGIIIGLSAASADMMYGIVAAFGITLISDFITLHLQWIRLAGGVILLIFGYHSFRSHPSTDASGNGSNNHTRVFFSTFLLTLTNPMTLFGFAAVFASIGVENVLHSHWFALLLVTGVFLGSLSWFAFLTTLVRFFKEKLNTNGIIIVNRTAGILLIFFGLIALWSGLQEALASSIR